MGVSTRRIISENILFGKVKEDPEMVAEEVLTGKRPVNWNVAGHLDHTVWVIMLDAREKERNRVCRA